jgi:dienelactone hydrolase
LSKLDQTHLMLAGAPCLAVSRDRPVQAARKGLVLFYHGFTATKETNLPELELLAGAGFLAVGVDAVGHGERRYPDFDERFPEQHSEQAFLDIVEATTGEIPKILDGLSEQGLLCDVRIGVAGVSMGGYITYGAVLADPRISAAVAIMGSPVWQGRGGRSPHHRPDGFFPTALLSQTAGRDSVVPAVNARRFHRVLEPLYAPHPERLSYIEFARADHMMAAEVWQQAITNLVAWFERFIE